MGELQHGHVEGGTIFGEVPDWDIANNPKQMASASIRKFEIKAEANKAGFTDEQIAFMRKNKII